jgi:hypothetical protein
MLILTQLALRGVALVFQDVLLLDGYLKKGASLR